MSAAFSSRHDIYFSTRMRWDLKFIGGKFFWNLEMELWICDIQSAIFVRLSIPAESAKVLAFYKANYEQSYPFEAHGKGSRKQFPFETDDPK